MAVRRMPVLPLPLASAVSFSLLSATVNLFSLSGDARVRDLRIIRLLRRVADQLDWNLLAAAPAWMHAERSLRSIGDTALLFVCAAIAMSCVLFPVALLFSIVLRRLRSGDAIAVSLLAMCALGLAAGGGLSPAMNALLCIGVALVVFAAFTMLPSSREWLSRAAIAGIAVGIIAAAFAPHANGQREAARHTARAGAPNIVLISIDSLRADHVHAYGYARPTSPNIDALAADGAVFETVISPTSWTLPAHMTLMTSLAPEEHGVITNRLRLGTDVDTLPMRLQRAGYTTEGFVSATYLDGVYGFSRGFDEYDDYTLLRVAGEKSRAAVSSHQVAQRAIDFLQHHAAAGDARPFFLFLHFFDVHYNYNPPQPFARMFDTGYAGHATGDVDSIHQGMSGRDLNHIIALYDGEIAWVDANIGNVLSTLRRLGIDDNTIVAITADHGEEFLEHGQAAHYKTLYDEVLRVPLVIRYPGHIVAGRRVQGQVRLMDIAPTLLTLAGLPVAKPHSGTQARSLACLMTSPDPRSAPVLPAFGDLRGEVASVRTGGAKLIRNLRTHREEFYDLARDPGERTNLDAVPQPQRDQLRSFLDHWRLTAISNPSNRHADLDEEEKAALRSLGYMQ